MVRTHYLSEETQPHLPGAMREGLAAKGKGDSFALALVDRGWLPILAGSSYCPGPGAN